jgi:hypothetical protein
MRIDVGAGYRVYYIRTGSTVYVLLAGGVKASQAKDIAKAKRMAREQRSPNKRGSNEEKEDNLQTIRRGGVSR